MSIFSKIIAGEIPSYKIAEDNDYLAFLDVFPLKKGHVLVIPKQEIDNIFDMSDDLLSGLHIFAKRVAKAMEVSFDCKKVGVAVVGLEVPHAHIHLIPINSVSEMDFSQEKMKLTQEDFIAIAEKIKANLV